MHDRRARVLHVADGLERVLGRPLDDRLLGQPGGELDSKPALDRVDQLRVQVRGRQLDRCEHISIVRPQPSDQAKLVVLQKRPSIGGFREAREQYDRGGWGDRFDHGLCRLKPVTSGGERPAHERPVR